MTADEVAERAKVVERGHVASRALDKLMTATRAELIDAATAMDVGQVLALGGKLDQLQRAAQAVVNATMSLEYGE